MKVLLPWLAAAIGLPSVIAAQAKPFRLHVVIDRNPFTEQRIWFGDGRAYVGHTVPADIKAALNVTLTLERRDVLFVDADTTTPAPPAPSLPRTTFLVAETSPARLGSLFLASDAKGLGPDDVYLWAGYGGLLQPLTRKSGPEALRADAGGVLVLVPVPGVGGTFEVRFAGGQWDASSERATRAGGSLQTGFLYVHDHWRD